MNKLLPYRQYLKTDHWEKLRKRFVRRAGYQCQICGSNINLQVHHKRYMNKDGTSILFNERGKDLQVLCSVCHCRAHEISY